MARNSIESEFRTSKMADRSHYVKNFKQFKFAYRSEMARNAIKIEFPPSKMADGNHFVKNFQKKIELHIDLKWPEIQSKVNFGHPKWPTQPSCQKFQKLLKLRIDLKWLEIQSKVNFEHPKWPTIAIMSKNLNKLKFAYRSAMARNAIESEFRTSKMGAGGHFVKKF